MAASAWSAGTVTNPKPFGRPDSETGIATSVAPKGVKASNSSSSETLKDRLPIKSLLVKGVPFLLLRRKRRGRRLRSTRPGGGIGPPPGGGGSLCQPGAFPDVSDPDRAGPLRNTRDRTIRLTAIRADNERLGAVYQITAPESSPM